MEPLNSPDEISIEELLKRPSSLPDIGATMRGFATEDDARIVANLVFGFLRMFGTYLDLERLERVTIAWDYREALAQIDRGGFQLVMTPTEDDIAVGVAMAVNVLREGKPRKHLVLNANIMSFLKNADDHNYNIAVHILAHEAAHVHDLARQDRAFPGVYGQMIDDSRDAVLFDIAQICWEEYIASLLSASYAPGNQTENFETTFLSSLVGIRDRSNSYIREYRTHANVSRLIAELGREYGTALKYGAYLLGHIEGLGQPLAEAATRANLAIRDLPWFSPLFEMFAKNLKAMYENYGEWSGLEVFDPLKNTVHDVLKVAGIEFKRRI